MIIDPALALARQEKAEAANVLLRAQLALAWYELSSHRSALLWVCEHTDVTQLPNYAFFERTIVTPMKTQTQMTRLSCQKLTETASKDANLQN